MINFHLLPPDCFVAINEIIKKFFFSYQQPYIKLQHNHATQSSKITIRKSTDKYWKITKWKTIKCFGFGKTGTSRQGEIFRPFLSCAIWIRNRPTDRSESVREFLIMLLLFQDRPICPWIPGCIKYFICIV